MASIEQRIGHLFPHERGKGPSSIAMVATLFAERRGQWLTQVDLIKLVNKKFGDSTIRKAFRELSLPMDALNGHSFIDTEYIKVKDHGGPILRGRLSDAATEKIFKLVTPVNQEPPSYFIREKQLEVPPLQIGDKYLSPECILSLLNEKYGEEYTRGLLNKMAKDKPGDDKAAMENLIKSMAKNEGIEFDAVTGQFNKNGRVVLPNANLINAHYKWKHELHSKDEPYTKASDVLKGHYYGPIPHHCHMLTNLAMLTLASDENRLGHSINGFIVDSREDYERVQTIGERAKKGDEEASNELIQILSSDGSKFARQEAARLLGCLDDPRVIEPLIEAMLGDEYIAVRSIAAEGLANFGYRLEFAQALNDSAPLFRRIIVEILGKIGDLRAVDPLIEALHDPDMGVQCSAANSLGKLRDNRAVDVLISKLDSKNESVRHAVADALGNIRDPRAGEALRKMCDDPSTWVREAVVKALQKLNGSI
jgi:hypothetical protein